jgi:hypothetical protein
VKQTLEPVLSKTLKPICPRDNHLMNYETREHIGRPLQKITSRQWYRITATLWDAVCATTIWMAISLF